MKEIKAYIRASTDTAELVKQLEAAGAPGVSLVDVRSEGYGFEPEHFPDRDIVGVVKIEMVCRDEHVQPLIDVLLKHACTGSPGDGWIFIAPVEVAVRVRDGARGDEIL